LVTHFFKERYQKSRRFILYTQSDAAIEHYSNTQWS
jgi:hypothetical protein